jgi:hypothetical protein
LWLTQLSGEQARSGFPLEVKSLLLELSNRITNQFDVWLLLHWTGCMVGSSRGQIAGFLAEVRALPKSVGGSLA